MGVKKNDENRIKIKATITDCRWYSDDTSWGVFEFITSDNIKHELLKEDFFDSKKMTGEIVGKVQKLEIGTEYLLELEVEYNKKYSKNQFKPITATLELPTTLDQQERFLKSILTENQTNSLLLEYPNIVSDILDNKHIDVSKLKGIGQSTMQSIKNKILDNYILIDLLSMLSPYGINYNQIKKISELSTNPMLVKKMIDNNPYVLTNIRGFGFKKVDGIALKINPKLKVSKFRAIEYIKYVLDDTSESKGHTWVERNFIINKARKDVSECIDFIKNILDEEKDNPTFLKIINNSIGLLINYNTEKAIFKELERINNCNTIVSIPEEKEIERIISITEEQQGFKLSDEQRKTVMSLKEDGNILVITGSAGTGKSTVARTIVNILESANSKNSQNNKMHLSQIALSAKAAKRINEVTNRPAKTIHRTLGYNGKSFIHNDEIQLPSNVVIFDEFSMVNIQLTLAVLKAIQSGTLLIFMFDYAQLPAIGSGAVAYDLLESMRYKTSKYVKVHRQAEMSGILSDANKIRQQKSPIKEFKSSITTGELKDMTYFFKKTQDEINELAIKYFVSGVEKYGIDNINIVTARKDSVINSADKFNKIIQDKVNPQIDGKYMFNKYKTLEFRIDDRVIHRVNNKEKNVYNGEMGVIINIDRDYNPNSERMEDVLIVNFGEDFDDNGNSVGDKIIKYNQEDLEELKLSYALTTHSMQGSENQAIIVVLDSSAYVLLDSTMLYTAITRAKKKCLLISDVNSFKTCIRENKTIIRNTYLKEMLKESEYII